MCRVAYYLNGRLKIRSANEIIKYKIIFIPEWSASTAVEEIGDFVVRVRTHRVSVVVVAAVVVGTAIQSLD